jgi:hypothetical protein
MVDRIADFAGSANPDPARSPTSSASPSARARSRSFENGRTEPRADGLVSNTYELVCVPDGDC